MKAVSEYKEIVPPKKWFATLVTRIFFFFIGMAMQTAYRVDPDVKKEVDSWPETFSFRMAVVGGPSLLMLKKKGHSAIWEKRKPFIVILNYGLKISPLLIWS